jgi:hypothetical protein
MALNRDWKSIETFSTDIVWARRCGQFLHDLHYFLSFVLKLSDREYRDAYAEDVKPPSQSKHIISCYYVYFLSLYWSILILSAIVSS